MDEYHTGLCSDPIDGATLVIRPCGSQVFSGCVSDNFFSGSVGLGLGVAVGVSVGSSMIPRFVVVAFCMEPKESDTFPQLFIVTLEIFSLLDISKIGVKAVAAAANDQVEKICPNQYSYHSLSAQATIDVKDYTSANASQEEYRRKDSLAMH